MHMQPESVHSGQVPRQTESPLRLEGRGFAIEWSFRYNEEAGASKRLCESYEECLQEAKDVGVLLLLHLKATMMKISEPIMFGHCVKVYCKEVFFAKYNDIIHRLGVDPNNGLRDV